MKCAKLWMAFLALLSLGMASPGREITLEQAETAVCNWAARGGGFGEFSGAHGLSGDTFVDPDTGVAMHVVRLPGKGFAVTSADDGIEPVILFSDGDADAFAAEDENPLWELLRRDLAVRRKGLEEGGGAVRKVAGGGDAAASARAKWAALLSGGDTPQKRGNGVADSQVGSIRCRPLLETSWNQTEGSHGGAYNLYTPEGYPVGCVAVAGGQMMKHWKYPENAVARTGTCRVDGEARELEFFGSQMADGIRTGSYGWDSMGGDEPVTALQSEYVSRLLSDIGVACGAGYRATGTGMALATLASEMKSTFGYASAVYHTANLSGTGLRQVLIPNLDAGAPVALGIGNAHAVVADGYGFDSGGDTFYVHVNLGWGRAAHYWYVPPEIDRYSSIDEIVCNIFPDFAGAILSGRVTGPNGRPVWGMDMRCDGSDTGAAATEADGIYHFRLGTGTYRVWGETPDGTSTDNPQEVTLDSTTRTSNGNRILDFHASGVKTVAGITVATVPPNAEPGLPETFSEPFELVLSCATEGAGIHYTLDGSLPGADSPLYEGPIPVYHTVTLRAVAFAEGMECSALLEGTCTFADPVSRDDFADARPLSGANGQSLFGNAGYTKETGEPLHSSLRYSGGASAWAVWTAPADGDWSFWLEGTDSAGSFPLDTQLAVYTGDAVGSLTCVAANDDSPAGGGSSRLSFHATGGTEYKIAMDTYRGAEGTMLLRWEEGYVHWVRFQYETRFVSRSGGRIEIGVESSTNWWVAECPDMVVPETMDGVNGDAFVCSMAANGTGAERRATVAIQARSSEQATLTLVQHPAMDFVTTKAEAVGQAMRENKRILLVRGRETCGNTRATLFSSIPSASVKALVDAGYVLWYSNCDEQQDASSYAAGLGPYTLPLVCILDPQDMSSYVARTTGYQSAAALLELLEANADWGGVLAVETETLVAATAGTRYEAVLEASGGTPPYTWGLKGGYSETPAAGTFAETGTARGWQGDDACWDLALPFAFPFFGHSYTNAKINSNGAISFGNADFTARSFLTDTFLSTPIVAVLWRDLLTSGGDIYVESGMDAVTVRWAGTAYTGGGEVNFSATLCRDGKIVLSYGSGNGLGGAIGISAGDGTLSHLAARSNGGSMANADDIVFEMVSVLPEGLSLSDGGVLQGTPEVPGAYSFTVVVTDAKGVAVSKELALTVQAPDAGPATATTPVAVPHAWLAEYGLGDGTAEGFETAAAAMAANGVHAVWQCYVAGVDPTDAGTTFTARISLSDGNPVLEAVSPDLGSERIYTLRGKKDLAEKEWTDLTGMAAPGAEGFRFFVACVSMPE